MNDYTIMAIEEQMSMCQELGATLLNQLNGEHQYIMECYEEGVVLEADNVADTRPKKSLWQRIKDFFARIFGLYKNKTEDMVAKNNQFLKEIKPLIITGSMDGLTLEVLDFNSTQKMADISNSIINKIKSVRDKSKEDANKILDEIEKTHGNGEGFASGLKMEFRIGNPNGSLTYTSYSGSNLRTKLSEMCDFCLNYQANINNAESSRKRYEDAIKDIEANFLSEKVAEGYLVLENCFINELVGLNVTLEADGSLTQQSLKRATQKRAEMNKQAENADKKEVNPTGGGIKKDENEENKEEQSINVGKGVTVTKNNAELENRIFKIGSTVMSAYITVLEEKYIAYIARLKDWANSDTDTKTKKSIKDLVTLPGKKVASVKRDVVNKADKVKNAKVSRGLVDK